MSLCLDSLSSEGYVILREFFDDDVVVGVCREMEAWVDRQAHHLCSEGINNRLYEDQPFETRLIHVLSQCPDRINTTIRRDLHLPGMFSLFFHLPLLDLVEQLLGPEIRLYPNYSVRPKLPDDSKTLVFWHQDAGYTSSGAHGHDGNSGEQTADQMRMVNVWTPLVPARRENGCMQFIPGTHRLGVVPHFKKNEYYLEITPDELQPRLKDAVDIELDPGDLVLFSNLLFHQGLCNRSQTIRWSCDWRYQDATQSTLRSERGHLARSDAHPETAVKSADQWAELEFC